MKLFIHARLNYPHQKTSFEISSSSPTPRLVLLFLVLVVLFGFLVAFLLFGLPFGLALGGGFFVLLGSGHGLAVFSDDAAGADSGLALLGVDLELDLGAVLAEAVALVVLLDILALEVAVVVLEGLAVQLDVGVVGGDEAESFAAVEEFHGTGVGGLLFVVLLWELDSSGGKSVFALDGVDGEGDLGVVADSVGVHLVIKDKVVTGEVKVLFLVIDRFAVELDVLILRGDESEALLAVEEFDLSGVGVVLIVVLAGVDINGDRFSSFHGDLGGLALAINLFEFVGDNHVFLEFGPFRFGVDLFPVDKDLEETKLDAEEKMINTKRETTR